jgi:hypothetical protein
VEEDAGKEEIVEDVVVIEQRQLPRAVVHVQIDPHCKLVPVLPGKNQLTFARSRQFLQLRSLNACRDWIRASLLESDIDPLHWLF